MERSTCIENAAKFWGSFGMALILLISVATPALALDYLDPTYGPPNGYVTLDGSNVQTILQSDDRLLVLNNGVLSRLMPDGSLDTSFGVNGVLDQVFSDRARVAYAPDGNIFVADVCTATLPYSTEISAILTRLLPNGQVDTTYNPTCVSLQITYPHLFIDDLLILPNGKVLVALFPMYVGDGFFGYSLLVQFDANGYPDTSFSNDGLFYPDVPPEVGGGGYNISLSKVSLLKDGTILLSGLVVDSPFLISTSSVLFRLTPDGQYDVSFSGDGMLVPYSETVDGLVQSFTIQENGRILTRGYETVSGLSAGVILGLTSDGGLDLEFGNQGKVAVPEKIDGLITLLDDSFLMAGSDPATNDIIIRHFSKNGDPDPVFGSGGLVTLNGELFGTIRDLHLQSNGQAVFRSSDNVQTVLARLDESLTPRPVFADVNFFHWANSWIERLYHSGITTGCQTAPLKYCPNAVVTRAQMAIFLLRGKYGAAYTPPAPSGSLFQDVPSDYWAAAWIEQLLNDGISTGCADNLFCPDDPVTRDQMAVFLLRAKYGYDYFPPYWASGIFKDVPADYWAAAWIEEIYREGITSGCGGVNYCPSAPVTRAQMAVFLVRTFNLP